MSSLDIYGKAIHIYVCVCVCSDLTNKWRMCELLKSGTDKTVAAVSQSVMSADSL